MKNGPWSGAPDPTVCLDLSAGRRCTQEGSETWRPSWNCAVADVSARELLGGVQMELFDNNRWGTGTCGEAVTAPPGNSICQSSLHVFTLDELTRGAWSQACAQGSFEGEVVAR